MKETFLARLERLASQVTLGMKCRIIIGQDLEFFDAEGNPAGRYYYQIECERLDAITGVMGVGRGGKAYLSEWATDSELFQTMFGLYKGYWEHEARETFVVRGRRPFGPHISTEALWDVARRVDVRSANHVEDLAGVKA